MKSIVLSFAAFSLLMMSCGSEEPSSNEEDNQSQTEEILEEVDPMNPYVREDGGEVYPMSDGKSMIVQQLDGGDCSGHDFNKFIDESKVIGDDSLVERTGDSLIFTTYPSASGDSRQVVLVNATTESDNWADHGFSYQYQGLLESIEYWVVFAIGYEDDKTILIDKFSGEQTEMVGIPCVSPDRRFVLVGNADMEAAFTENHLSLYSWTSDGLDLLVKAPLDTMGWAPYEVNWTDDYHFRIKQGRFNEETYGIDFSCAEVTIE